MLGPTIVTTGPIIGRAHTPEQAVKIVDEIAAAGYDGVKIYNQVSKEEYPALIAEARRKNLLLMGHVARGPEFELTVASGQSIAHLEEFTYTYFNPQHDDKNRHIVYDESKIPAVVKITAASGVFVTPTLCTYAQIVQQATEIESFLKRPDLKYTAPWLLEAFQPATNRYKNGFGPDSYAQIRTSLAFQRKLVKALQQGGVPLLSGTDSSDVGPVAGFSIHDELQELVSDGLTPFQALQTATVNPARYFRLAAEAGTVEPGRRADLLLLDHNPLGDISATRQIAGVMVHGTWLPAADLRKMQEQVPREYQRQIRQIEQQIGSDPARAEEFLKDNDPLGNLGPAAITGLLASHDFSAFENIIHKVRETNPQSNLASEETINNLGYRLLNNKKYREALLIFRLNTQAFPRSANAFDSLGEALFNSGDEPAAVAAYQHALEIDPKYPNAEAAVKFVEEHGKKK
jgi:hypothetical protein